MIKNRKRSMRNIQGKKTLKLCWPMRLFPAGSLVGKTYKSIKEEMVSRNESYYRPNIFLDRFDSSQIYKSILAFMVILFKTLNYLKTWYYLHCII